MATFTDRDGDDLMIEPSSDDDGNLFVLSRAGAFISPKKLRELIDKAEAETHPADQANLGLATTRELLAEITARIEVDKATGGGGLDYRTADSS